MLCELWQGLPEGQVLGDCGSRSRHQHLACFLRGSSKRSEPPHPSRRGSRQGAEAGRAAGSAGSGTSLALQGCTQGGWQDVPALGSGVLAAADQECG